MKLTILITSSRVAFSSDGSVLDARAYLCIMQWVCLVSGLTAFTRTRNPERLPSMAVAPPVVHALTLEFAF